MRTLKIAFLAILLLSLVGNAVSQDVILKKDNTTILSKVLEINSTEIKYKKWSNQEGPTYSISRSEVSRINYQNGDVDKFTENVVTAPTPQPNVVVPVTTQEPVSAQEVQTPQPQPEPKPEKPKSPYSRSRTQFSIIGGASFPMGQFGKFSESHNSLYDYCAPFQLFAEALGTYDEVGMGAANIGFSGSLALHFPCYVKGKSIVGIPLKFNIFYNGIKDSEQKDLQPIWDLMSNMMNQQYGVNAFQFKNSKSSSYLNFSFLTGVDYTYYFSKPFALFMEANLGLNICQVTPTKLQNQLGGTYISTYSIYSMKESNVVYKTNASFAYEIGGGLFLFNHLSLGVYYSGFSPVKLQYYMKGGNWSDEDAATFAQKLRVSTLSVRLGYHF